MPRYAFLADTQLDYTLIERGMTAQRLLGVPYSDADIANASQDLLAQANVGADQEAVGKRYPKAVAVPGRPGFPSEMDALVAYLQVLGTMVDFADTGVEKLQQ